MTKSFLFLPDISGFTDFVSQTEINHSKHIISEVLEILIESNILGLQLAEIEGDALFYYLEGKLPSLSDLNQQVEQMFLAFHNHLRLYDHQRICECGACQTAADLKLKFFAHAGEIQFVELKNFKKPHGKEVIVVHRLMKNSVPINEYLLASEGYLNEMDGAHGKTKDIEFETGMDVYDAGSINYCYSNLEKLHDRLNELPSYTGETDSIDPIKVTGVVEVPPNALFELLSNLKYRHLWNQGVTKILYDEKHLNRQGQEHVCVIEGKEVVFETVGKSDNGSGRLIYGEKTHNIPLIEKAVNYFVIEKDDVGSRLTIESHLDAKSFLGALVKPFFKRKLKKNMLKLFSNIQSLEDKNPLI